MKRRDFLRAASGGAAVTASAGAAQATAPPSSGATPAQESGTTTAGTGTTTAGNGTGNGSGNATVTTGAPAPSGETHTVGMASSAFEPDSITIAPGDTVEFENTSAVGHTVTAYEEDLPEGASYFASGGWDSEEAARSNYAMGDASSGFIPAGETYTHTFTTEGTFEYYCIPHEAAGMTGTVEVVPGGGDDGGGGGGHGGPLSPHEMGVPFQAHFVGIATVLMMFVSLIYTFFVVKYGGSPHASSPNRRN